jgi:hypothetical protein
MDLLLNLHAHRCTALRVPVQVNQLGKINHDLQVPTSTVVNAVPPSTANCAI